MSLQQASIENRAILVIGHNKRFYLRVKRWMDIVLSLALVVLLAPLIIFICICIKLDSPGPVFFRQTRAGQNCRRRERRAQRLSGMANLGERRARKDRREKNLHGKPFAFFKFRTMYVNADPEIHRQFVQELIKNQTTETPAAKKPGTPTYKMDRDPRVTRVGRILRKTSLDELPQLFNVLRGEMSLVGPRPPIPYEVDYYQEWHRERLYVLPGITGLWQVHGRSRVPFDEMVRMDLYYIEHMSLSLDLKILIRTPWAVLSAKGAA